MNLIDGAEKADRKGREVKRVDALRELGSLFSMAAESLEATHALDLGEGLDFYQEVRCFEISLIKRALKQTHGNQSQAARLLNLNQTTLHGKIKQYSIYPVGLIYPANESVEEKEAVP